MKKILVLGGTGFVGRHVCEKLVSAGRQVTVPTRQRPNANAIAVLRWCSAMTQWSTWWPSCKVMKPPLTRRMCSCPKK
jgi:nucleoside-diphosphate-sugar epimerase